MRKKYKTDEERKAAHRAQTAKYRSTPIGRANNLLKNYRREDKKNNRGNCTLSAEWIVNNIFSGQVCTHCGESDWRKLGVNRIDNSKPHTPDNCEPCCYRCNVRLYGEESSKTVYQYTLDCLLVAIWSSVNECGRNGYNYGHVSECCRGERKKHKGYRWSYKPLNKVCQLEFNFK